MENLEFSCKPIVLNNIAKYAYRGIREKLTDPSIFVSTLGHEIILVDYVISFEGLINASSFLEKELGIPF